MEAASYLFFSQADYHLPYDTFLSLFRRGLFQGEILELMSQAFYFPNVPDLKKQYERNCKLLAQYPYCFKTEFPPFDDLPILFFPYDHQSYVPYDPETNTFDDCIDFNYPVIDQYFFRDLEKPILGKDVYSQYQLEYLRDTVRKSEWVGRENHIYLHYTHWMKFCNYLQCLDLRKLLKDEKFVFLFGDEISQYPIDFKERFGLDYSQYPVKPLGVQEIDRLIWHTQLSAHNGGDFFNEIFHGHPNLLVFESIILEEAEDIVKELRRLMRNRSTMRSSILTRLSNIRHPSDKDLLVAFFLDRKNLHQGLDPNSRIVPALFFQPHFHNIHYTAQVYPEGGRCTLSSEQYNLIQRSPLFQGFKYIKTFVPLRRPTTSYGACIRFALNYPYEAIKYSHVTDVLGTQILNRSYWADPKDRLFQDSVVVRFEDAKLNPKATFTALAEFLDLPYTQSMTYCSGVNGLNPESLPGNDIGFSTAAVYRTYDDYTDDADRAFIEYFMGDAYGAYGYDFLYYKGEPVDAQWIKEKSEGASHLTQFILETREESAYQQIIDKEGKGEQEAREMAKEDTKLYLKTIMENRLYIAEQLLPDLPFTNEEGQLRRMIPLLKLDPALLEQPLYH